MTGKEFDKIVKNRVSKIYNTLSVKAKEYRRNDNALHNFEVGANMTKQLSIRVLDGFLIKHLVSYRDMLDDIDRGLIPTEEYVDEKLGDIINYFILQEAQIKNMIK